MSFPFGSILEPLPEELDLLLGHRFLGLGRRHHLLGVIGEDAVPKLAFVELARDDGPGAVAVGEGGFLEVEAQLGLPRFLGGSVAVEALARENRPDVAVEANGFLSHYRDGEGKRQQGEKCKAFTHDAD